MTNKLKLRPTKNGHLANFHKVLFYAERHLQNAEMFQAMEPAERSTAIWATILKANSKQRRIWADLGYAETQAK